jgi:hypothetical protein
MAIRYDIEVERTVTVTAMPRLTNSRRAIDWRKRARGVGVFGIYLTIGLFAVWLVVAIPNLIDGLTDTPTVHHYLNEPSPTEDYGKAPDDLPPVVKSKPKKAKPKARPVERTAIEPPQPAAENFGDYDGGWNGGRNSRWCTGTANLPPVPYMCRWVVRNTRQ